MQAVGIGKCFRTEQRHTHQYKTRIVPQGEMWKDGWLPVSTQLEKQYVKLNSTKII